MPVGLSGWLGLAIKIILPFLSGGYLLTRILAHAICLSGQRTSEDSDETVTCRFALQNNEEVSLTTHQRLSIRILDEGGRFEDNSAILVFAGCNRIRANFDASRKTWTMTFSELPAYDTWTIECKMNRESRNIEVMLQDEGSSFRSPFLSHDRLLLTSDRKSAFAGHKTTPEFLWVLIATTLASGAYAASVLGFNITPENWTIRDWQAEGLIVAFATALYFANRRDSSAISQGYWRPTTLDVADVPGPAAGISGVDTK